MDKVKVKNLTKRLLTVTVDNGDRKAKPPKPPRAVYFLPKAILELKKADAESVGVQTLVRGGFLKVIADDSKSGKKKKSGGGH